MTYYQLKARLVSPLLVQENRQSNVPRGLKFLPGASLRGAVAGRYLRRGGDPESEKFQNIFIKHPVNFPDLLPANSAGQLPQMLPATAFSCKRTPGFRAEQGHGTGDCLAALAASELEGRPVTELFECKICGQDMKPLDGFWNGDVSFPERTEPVEIYQRHTGIDRQTGTAAASIFYITQGIAEGRTTPAGKYDDQYLAGGIYLTEDQAEILSDWISGPVFAGADRTRGMGEMALSLEQRQPPVFDPKGWDRDFREKLERTTSKALPSGLYFTIGLQAHAILVDSFLRPTAELTPGFPDIEPILRVVRGHALRGWHSSWRLPKQEETAVAMGGVYLFLYKNEDLEGLETFLKQLTIRGIGLRRPEGCGRLRVCDPLHVQEVI